MELPHFLAALPAREHVADEPFPESRRWPALGVLSAAMFISAVDMTIVNVALPEGGAGGERRRAFDAAARLGFGVAAMLLFLAALVALVGLRQGGGS